MHLHIQILRHPSSLRLWRLAAKQRLHRLIRNQYRYLNEVHIRAKYFLHMNGRSSPELRLTCSYQLDQPYVTALNDP